jgi:hypothetical protein
MTQDQMELRTAIVDCCCLALGFGGLGFIVALFL